MNPSERFTLLSVRIQPNSRANKVVEIREDGSVKIKINAPAVDGRANKALCKFLHEILNIPVSNIEIMRGELCREKTIRIHGLDAETGMNIIRNLVNN